MHLFVTQQLCNRFLILCCLFLVATFSQPLHAQDTLKVHFYYGSVPAKAFKSEEKAYFGGMHGGHASIETCEGVYGFGSEGKFHVIPRRRQRKQTSYFRYERMEDFCQDSIGRRYLTVYVPVTEATMLKVDSIHHAYNACAPYDYAFMGMRCAASTSDVLALAGVLPELPNRGRFKYFYPRKLRNRMVKLAVANDWRMVYRDGNKRRRWERDLKKTERLIAGNAEILPVSYSNFTSRD